MFSGTHWGGAYVCSREKSMFTVSDHAAKETDEDQMLRGWQTFRDRTGSPILLVTKDTVFLGPKSKARSYVTSKCAHKSEALATQVCPCPPELDSRTHVKPDTEVHL